jgi:hypothetical protein
VLYDLTRLGSQEFENLIRDLLIDICSQRKLDFRSGPYGGREVIVTGELLWPSSLRMSTWSNRTAVTLFYAPRQFVTSEEEGKWLYETLKDSFTSWQKAYEQNLINIAKNEEYHKRGYKKYNAYPERTFPSNLLIVSNVSANAFQPSSQWPERDINWLLKTHLNAVKLRNTAIWDYGQLCAMLTERNDIRRRYAGYLIPPDGLSRIHEYTQGVTAEFGDIIGRQVAMDLGADRWIKLSQSGDPNHEKISLSRVAIDLPLERGEEAASFILDGSNRILRRGVRDAQKPDVVLVGGPGQGKTTIGQLVCQVHRAALLGNAPWVDIDTRRLLRSVQDALQRLGLSIPAYRRWPVRVELSVYADEAADNRQLSLLRYLAERVGSRTSDVIDTAKLRNWLGEWPWLLVLDGLDEVASRPARDMVMDRIADFLIEAGRQDADLFIVVTTRPQGYTGEFSADRYQHLYLKALNPHQALRYAERLAEVRHGTDPDMRQKIIDRTMAAAAEEATARLMRTPLQVTIMSLLLEARQRVPQARYALFDTYYETIYAREAAKSGTLAELLEKYHSHINALHDRVGLLLQVKAEQLGTADAGLPRDDLHALASERLTDEGYSTEETSRLVRDIVMAVTQRLVLIVPKGIDDVGFEIRSIQEFMAARAIANGHPDAVIERLRSILPASHWRNTYMLAAGRVFTKSEQEHLRRSLISLLPETDSTDFLHMAVAPGADLALDLLDDDIAAATPKFRRMLARHALTLLNCPPDQDLERHAGVLFRYASDDQFIRAAVEQAIDQALSGSLAQAKAAELVCRTWKQRTGPLALRSRLIIDRLASRSRARPSQSGTKAGSIADLIRDHLNEADLDPSETELASRLITHLESVRIRSEGVGVNDAMTLAATRGDGVIDECLSNQSIVDVIARASMAAGAFTWVGAAELRNLLRAWLQRQPAGTQLLALMPFPSPGDKAHQESLDDGDYGALRGPAETQVRTGRLCRFAYRRPTGHRRLHHRCTPEVAPGTERQARPGRRCRCRRNLVACCHWRPGCPAGLRGGNRTARPGGTGMVCPL